MNKDFEGIRVVFIGGVEHGVKCGVMDYTLKLQEELRNRNIDVYNASVDNNEIRSWKSLFSYLNLLIRIKKRGNAILHIEYPAKAYGKAIAINFVPFFARIVGINILFTSHEYSNRSFLGRLRQIPSLIFANKIIVVDKMFEKDIKKIPFCKHKVDTICIGSNIPKSVKSDLEIQSIRKEMISNREHLMCYFGFINEYKCFLEILDAIVLLKKDGELTSRFMVIGELREEDEYQSRVLDKIKKENLVEDIVVTGYMEHGVEDYIRASDFAVLPFLYGVSVRNGSFLSAYQENINIITTKSSGEFPYGDVYFVEKNTPVDIAKAIKKVQKLTKSDINRDTCFDWGKIAERHIQKYYDILK